MIGINNYVFMKRGGPPSGPSNNRHAPAPDNYRGRYQAERHAQGKSRLPDDWDVHHRIPQEYRDHPDFKGFDFDAPSNTQGIRGSRQADKANNIHQRVTNDWANFRGANPNASRPQIEKFAGEMDKKYAAEWFK